MTPSILAAVVQHSAKRPSKPALIMTGQAVTYSDLWRQAQCAAARLRGMGVMAGDRVIVMASSVAEFVYVYLGLHLCGAVAVPLDPASPRPRVDYIAEFVKPALVISSRRLNVSHCREVAIKEFRSDAAGERDFAQETALPAPDQVADILFTTGTTGTPKGVLLSHANIWHAAHNINTFIGNSGADVEVIPLPFCHSFGLARLRCNLLAGGGIKLVSGFTFPKLILDALQQEHATGLAAVPAGIKLLLQHSPERLAQCAPYLRYIEIGSSPMALEDKRELMHLLPQTRICMHYGLTEASRSTFIEFHSSANKLESIGRPSPNVEVKITDGSAELPPGRSGTIFVRGGMVMQGYYRLPEMTQEVFQDGWFNTGDWGYKDAEGYLFLEGREKELINIGGRKVAPIEIENLLNTVEGIEDCACVAIPDPNGVTGQAAKVFLFSGRPPEERPTFGGLSTFLREHLEPYKIPAAYEWVARIPRTSSGKIQRFKLAKL